MRQFHSCQMCHNQWIPAYSHQSPVQPLGDVCCTGAKETAHRPVVLLSPLLHLAGQKICVCLRTFAPSAITHAHGPLESPGITVRRGHQRLCLSDAGSGSRATLQHLMSSPPAQAAPCPLPAGFHAARITWCLLPGLGSLLGSHPGKWPQSFGARSPASLHCWLMRSTQP